MVRLSTSVLIVLALAHVGHQSSVDQVIMAALLPIVAQSQLSSQQAANLPQPAVNPGPQQAAYPGPQQAAYPGPQQAAYPGQQQAAYPGQQQAAYPGPQQAAYPGQQQAANPGQQQAAYPGQQQAAYPGQQQAAYPGPQPAANPPPQFASSEAAEMITCLYSKGFDISAPPATTDQDLRCYVKYLWLWTHKMGMTAESFFSSNRGDYAQIYSNNEPSRNTTNVDYSCLSGVTPSVPVYYPVVWNCLEYCSSLCKPFRKRRELPVGSVSCKSAGGYGCNERRICSCKNLEGVSCGEDKTFTYGDMLTAYNDRCLNCFFKRYESPDPKRKCIPGTENYKSKPKAAFREMRKLLRQSLQAQPPPQQVISN